MGSIGDPISPSIPPVGSAGPQFATDINAILTEVVSRLSVKVPNSSVNFSAGQDMLGSTILNAGYITLVNSSVSPIISPVNRLTSYLGDLWYVSPSGAIQLTTGASLNAAGIGGITGSYGGANPAQFRYDSGNTRYDAFANFGTNTWAYVRALGFDVAAGATSSVFARLLFGGGSNITVTLPATLPGATSIMSIAPSGQIATIPTGGTINYGVNAITLNTGAILSTSVNPPVILLQTNISPNNLNLPLFGLPVGATITSWTVYLNKTSATGTIAAQGRSYNQATNGPANFGTQQTNGSPSPGNIQLTNSGLSIVVAADTWYSISMFGGGTSGDQIQGYKVVYS